MRQTNKNFPRSDQESSIGELEEQSVGVASLIESVKSFASIVGRQSRLFLVVIPCALALGLTYLLTTQPSYTTVAKMVIDPRKEPAFQQQNLVIRQ